MNVALNEINDSFKKIFKAKYTKVLIAILGL